MTEPEIIARVENGVGRISLNRPVCEAIPGLLAWRADAAVLIDHAGERSFCAGGDIRLIAEGKHV